MWGLLRWKISLGGNDQNRIITACSTRNIYQDAKFLPKIKCACWTRICLCAYTDHHLHLSVLFNVCKLIPPTLIIRLIILSWHSLTSKMFQLLASLKCVSKFCCRVLYCCYSMIGHLWDFPYRRFYYGRNIPMFIWLRYPGIKVRGATDCTHKLWVSKCIKLHGFKWLVIWIHVV